MTVKKARKEGRTGGWNPWRPRAVFSQTVGKDQGSIFDKFSDTHIQHSAHKKSNTYLRRFPTTV